MIKPAASAPTILLKVRRLETSDVAAYRELRLESLNGSLRVLLGVRGGEADLMVVSAPGNEHCFWCSRRTHVGCDYALITAALTPRPEIDA